MGVSKIENNQKTYVEIAQLAENVGLRCCGGFHISETLEAQTDLPTGIKTVILIGNTGSAFWRQFKKARPAGPHPINRWTRDNLLEIADQLSARTIFPFDGPPFPPFQKWAMWTEDVFPSPIGPLVHGEFGLWHAYRGALLFESRTELPPRTDNPASPCDNCPDKPCMKSCPVDVFSDDPFNFKACVGYVNSTAGKDCRSNGCQARRACPVGSDHCYEPDQAAYHMQFFLENVERFITD